MGLLKYKRTKGYYLIILLIKNYINMHQANYHNMYNVLLLQVSWERNTQRRDKLTAPELVIKRYSW
jgi:hypothetical protein